MKKTPEKQTTTLDKTLEIPRNTLENLKKTLENLKKTLKNLKKTLKNLRKPKIFCFYKKNCEAADRFFSTEPSHQQLGEVESL